MILLILDSAL